MEGSVKLGLLFCIGLLYGVTGLISSRQESASKWMEF